LGTEKSVEGMWALLKTSLDIIDLNCGTFKLLDQKNSEIASQTTDESLNIEYCPTGKFAYVEDLKKQNGIIRFNCADSLDRTNIATFCILYLLT
jgi:hypothetical protein